MSVKLKEETVLNEWSVMLDNAAEHADVLIQDIQDRIKDADIPGQVHVVLDEVQAGGMFSKTKREFLILTPNEFREYHTYISARPYGKHLDVCRYTTLEPGAFKKLVGVAIAGSDVGSVAAAALARPKNILHEQDLRAWVTVVHRCCIDAAKALLSKLDQDPTALRTDTTGMLAIW